MDRRALWLLCLLLAVAPPSVRADEVADAKARIGVQLRDYERMLEEAGRRYRLVLVGKLKNRAGNPLPDATVLRPVTRAEQKIHNHRQALTAMEARIGNADVPYAKTDFARDVDRIWGEVTSAVWGVLLDEATQKVALLQQMYDQEAGALRKSLARGGPAAKPRVAGEEEALRERVEARFKLVATRLRDERLDLLRRIDAYVAEAERSGRSHVKAQASELKKAEFSLDESGATRSRLLLKLKLLDLTLGSVVGTDSKHLRLADALRRETGPTVPQLQEIRLRFEVQAFDGVPAEGPGVEEGGLLTLHANLYPSDLDVYEAEISVEHDGTRTWHKTLNVRREREGSWTFASKPMRVAGGSLDPVPRPGDPAGDRRIEAAIGDRIVATFKSARLPILVREARPSLRFVRVAGDASRPASGELLFGVPYHLEARFQRYQDNGSPQVQLDWGDDLPDRTRSFLLAGIGTPDGQGRYARFRSRERFVLVDKSRGAAPLPETRAGPVEGDLSHADWMLGTWRVAYDDLAFEHGVEGVAHVTKPAQGRSALQIHVDLKDPATQHVFHLAATAFRITDDGAELTLDGQSPSSAVTFDGEKDVRQWPDQGTLVDRSLPPGTLIDASLGGMHARLPAQPDAHFPMKTEVKLSLRRQGRDTLQGTWSYPHGDQGLYGRRQGPVSGGRVTRREGWNRGGPNSIRSVEELKDQRHARAAEGEDPPSVLTVLEIVGFELPTTAQALGRAVTFDDPQIAFDSFVSATPSGPFSGGSPPAPGTLRVRIRLLAGVLPGVKGIRVKDVPGSWALAFGEDPPHVEFQTTDAAGHVSNASRLAMGQTFVLQVKFQDNLPFSHRLARFDTLRGASPRVLLARDDRDGTVYRSGRILVARPGTPTRAPEGTRVLPVRAESDLEVGSGDTEREIHWASIPVLDAFERGRLVIHPPGPWLGSGSLGAVSVDDAFEVRLRLPAPPDPAGKTVSFAVRGKSLRAQVALRVLAGAADAPVVDYVSQGTLTIGKGARDGPAGSPQRALDLAGLANGDVIDASYGDVTTSFTVYETRLKRRLAVRKQQVQALLRAVEGDGKLPMKDAERRIVQARLQLAKNALALVARTDLWDAERVAILEAYLGMLQEPMSLHDPSTAGTHRRYAVPCISRRESTLLDEAVARKADDVVRNMMTGWSQEVGLAPVDFGMRQSGTPTAWTAVTGTNLLGKRVNVLERVFAGLDFFDKILQGAFALSGSADKEPFAAPWIRRTQALQREAEARRLEREKQKLALDQRKRALAERLKGLGLDAKTARARAESVLDRFPGLGSDAAAVVAAREAGIDIDTATRELHMTRQDLAKHLDEHLRRDMGIVDPAERAQLLRSYESVRRPPSGAKGGAPSASGPGVAQLGNPGAPLPDEEELARRGADANQAHNGRARMQRYFDQADAVERRLALARGVGAAEIDTTLKARAAHRERVLKLVDQVERVNGQRTLDDYDRLDFLMEDQGLSDRQRVVGALWSSSGRNSTDPAVADAARTRQRRIPEALGITRAQWEQDLRDFVRIHYGDASGSAPVDRIVKDYFDFVDGG